MTCISDTIMFNDFALHSLIIFKPPEKLLGRTIQLPYSWLRPYTDGGWVSALFTTIHCTHLCMWHFTWRTALHVHDSSAAVAELVYVLAGLEDKYMWEVEWEQSRIRELDISSTELQEDTLFDMLMRCNGFTYLMLGYCEFFTDRVSLCDPPRVLDLSL